MKIDKIILSTNDDPLYFPFWNIVSKFWSKVIKIEPVLFYVGKQNPSILGLREDFGQIIHFSDSSNVESSNLSQIIRFFGPTLFPDETCLISDVDMLPLNRDYYVNQKKIIEFEEESVCFYSGDWGNQIRFPMCYIAAKGKVFEEIINSNYQNFNKEVENWMSRGHGWHTDEIVFSKLWKESSFSNNSLLLSRGWSNNMAHNRLDRSCMHMFNEKKIPEYIDFHMMRPILKNKKFLEIFEDYYGI